MHSNVKFIIKELTYLLGVLSSVEIKTSKIIDSVSVLQMDGTDIGPFIG